MVLDLCNCDMSSFMDWLLETPMDIVSGLL